MSKSLESILAQLQEKKLPSKHTEVKIETGPKPQQLVGIEGVKVLDKTESSKIDRTALLEKLGKKVPVESKISAKVVETEEEDFDPLEALKALQDLEDKEEAGPSEPKPKPIGKLVLRPGTGTSSRPGSSRPGSSRPGSSRPGSSYTIASTPQIPVPELTDKLPKPSDPILITASAYYMNNREIFINFINSLLEPYKAELQKPINYNCESKENEKFELLTHQKIVRDYINLYTPYRGLLLYHGLRFR